MKFRRAITMRIVIEDSKENKIETLFETLKVVSQRKGVIKTKMFLLYPV